jgi:HAD superfamily hydrolase (TIGR01549 family)
MSQAITFDFHNTLVACDPWFEIEVRSLCGRFLDWRSGGTADRALMADADRRYRTLREAIIDHGRELTAEQCVASVLGEMGIAVDAGEIETGVETIMMATLEHARAIPGALALVQDLATAGYPLAIVSSAVYHPFLDASLEKLGFSGLFQSVVTSASCGFYKSRPEIYLLTLEGLDAKPEHSLHVGDSYRFDVLGGKRAGMATVWLSADPDANAKSPAPDAIVATLVDAGSAIRAALPTRA